MQKLIILLLSLLVMIGCTISPKELGKNLSKENINTALICANKIDILPLSINGAKPPQEAFDYSLKKIKKYTTSNIVVHQMEELSIEKDKINEFIENFTNRKELDANLSQKVDNVLKDFPKGQSSIVMIYTPSLLCNIRNGIELRGRSYPYKGAFNIVAYNQTTIDKAPVISDTQAWKIVLTHEMGHRFGLPESVTHNRDGHCTNPDCILYAGPDWKAVVSVLFHGMPYDFCDDCKAELRYAKEHACRYYGAYGDDIIYTTPYKSTDKTAK